MIYDWPSGDGRGRGAIHSFEKAYEIFSEQKDSYGFFMDFSCKQKDFCQRRTRFFGVTRPSDGGTSQTGNERFNKLFVMQSSSIAAIIAE